MNTENIYMHNAAIKKNEIVSFVEKWIELEIIMLSEKNSTQKGKYHVLSHMKTKANKKKFKKLTWKSDY